MTDTEAMGQWFATATAPLLAIYNHRMIVASAYRGSPRWVREQIKAQAEYEAAIECHSATGLYRLAMADLENMGEISSQTDELLTAFVADDRRLEAAE